MRCYAVHFACNGLWDDFNAKSGKTTDREKKSLRGAITARFTNGQDCANFMEVILRILRHKTASWVIKILTSFGKQDKGSVTAKQSHPLNADRQSRSGIGWGVTVLLNVFRAARERPKMGICCRFWVLLNVLLRDFGCYRENKQKFFPMPELCNRMMSSKCAFSLVCVGIAPSELDHFGIIRKN